MNPRGPEIRGWPLSSLNHRNTTVSPGQESTRTELLHVEQSLGMRLLTEASTEDAD
jgi:hypothetical protein